jgi:hypothetical protein
MFERFASIFDRVVDMILHGSVSVKVQFAIQCRFRKFKINEQGEEEHIVKDEWISLKPIPVATPQDIQNPNVVSALQAFAERYETNGSKWVIERLLIAEWIAVKYSNISYMRGLGARGHDQRVRPCWEKDSSEDRGYYDKRLPTAAEM